MILNPNQRSQIMPLPVVLLSTISSDGVRNAAPWSCVIPILRPLEEVLIASWLKRDTLENIRQTGEFVINVPRAGMEEAVMACAKSFSPEVDEFERRGMAGIGQGQCPRNRGLSGWAGVSGGDRPGGYIIVISGWHLRRREVLFLENGMDFERPNTMYNGLGGMHFASPADTGYKGSARYALSWDSGPLHPQPGFNFSFEKLFAHRRLNQSFCLRN